jgi:DNA-binding beta-propeller fold protein YncE
VSSLGQVFVPHLCASPFSIPLDFFFFFHPAALNHVLDITFSGLNSIWIYNFDPHTKSLEFLTEVKSLQPDDGPRHAVVSEDGKRLYVVTEHSELSPLTFVN